MNNFKNELNGSMIMHIAKAKKYVHTVYKPCSRRDVGMSTSRIRAFDSRKSLRDGECIPEPPKGLHGEKSKRALERGHLEWLNEDSSTARLQ